MTVYRLPIRLPAKSALTWGVALLGVKVTGIEPPRLTFVTVYRLPIRLPAKSAQLVVSSIPVVRTFFVKKKRKKKKEEASPQGKNRAMWGEEAKPLKHKNDACLLYTSDAADE